MSGGPTFLHLCNLHSTNVGNGALIFGTERVLQEDLGTGLRFQREAWDDYTLGDERRAFGQPFVDLVNREADALLVGAAVTLNGSPRYAQAGMRVDLPLRLWPQIRKPIIFYGISYRHWPAQRYVHLDRLRRTVAYLLERDDVLFSVRNDGSKAWLESLLGFASDRIATIPDPALYVPPQPTAHPQLLEGKLNILVALNDEDALYRFGGLARELAWASFAPLIRESIMARAWRATPGWALRRGRFLRRLLEALERLAASREVNLILCPHDHPDFRMMADILAMRPAGRLQQGAIATGLHRAVGAPAFYDLYAKADLVVSMRVHSMVPAIGLGTPVIGLVSQRRMRQFMADAGLEEFTVDVSDGALRDRIFELMMRMIQQRASVVRRLQAARAAMRSRSAEYHRRIAALLGMPARAPSDSSVAEADPQPVGREG